MAALELHTARNGAAVCLVLLALIAALTIALSPPSTPIAVSVALDDLDASFVDTGDSGEVAQ